MLRQMRLLGELSLCLVDALGLRYCPPRTWDMNQRHHLSQFRQLEMRHLRKPEEGEIQYSSPFPWSQPRFRMGSLRIFSNRGFSSCCNFAVVGSRPKNWGWGMMSPAEYPDRIWFYPSRFWAATKTMSAEAADELLNHVIQLAESEDLDELSRFDFVHFGNPWRKVP